MGKCIVPGCEHMQANKERRSFHKFPKNEMRKVTWLKAIGLLNVIVPKTAVVCSDHFSKNCFDLTSACGLVRLRENVVPNICIGNNLYDEPCIEPCADNVEFTEKNESTNKMVLASSSASAQVEDVDDIFEEDPLKLNAGTRQTTKSIEMEDLDIEKICRGCLNVTDIKNIKDVFFDDISGIELYEDIIKTKAKWENMPAMMCENCITKIKKVDEFIKLLKHSYLILENAYNEIRQLEGQKDLDPNNYNLVKNNILKNALNGKFTKNAEADKSASKEENICNNTPKLQMETIRIFYESDTSDDVPLSKCKNSTKESSEKVLPTKKRHRKSKDLPVKNSIGKSKTLLQSEGKDDFCPICSAKIRNFSKHLQTVHNLEWVESKCLNCSYHNENKEKLVEHSNLCSKMGLKDKENEYVDPEELKIEMSELVNDSTDADFDADDIDREELDNSECEDECIEMAKAEYIRRQKRKKKFTCNKCEGIIFPNYAEIESHLKTVHSEESNCIVCGKDFSNSFSLLYHMMVKHGKLKCCRLCLVSFNNSDELAVHYKSEEHNTKCSVCEEQFKNRKALYEHRRKKHLNPQLEHIKFKCPQCPKEFANQNNIRRHIMVAHHDLRFLCDTCGQSYTTKRNLRIHIQKFHEGIQIENKNTKKNFFCEACGRELRIFHKYAISMHMAKHKGHSCVCKKCYESFATEQEFKKHVEDLGHQLFQCDKCQAQFVRQESFKVHLKNHDAPGWNKNMFAIWGKSAKLRNDKGEFVCSYCPKVFKDKQRLDNHIRVHTNERPYKCHICSKGFKTWIHRKTHLNIHLGIKKWVCKYCAKAFTNSCTLKGHEMIHTGERPHRCPECKKGFITLSAMKKHRMVHFRTSASNNGRKVQQKNHSKNAEVKTDSDNEENAEFMYKYGQLFAGSEGSYESFDDTKQDNMGIIPIDKELSC